MKATSMPADSNFAEAIFRSYGADLHRYLLRRLQHAQDAEDLAQEVYMQLVRMDRARLIRSPRAYALRIAANVASDFLRSADVLRRRISFDSPTVEQLTEHPAEIDVDDPVARLLTQRQLRAALERLPPAHQAAFVLQNREGYSYEEIARRLRVSVRKVERLLAEAKEQLQMLLGAGGNSEP
jgi:RNA polymerase sigma-70 factor (ECF subfamily)